MKLRSLCFALVASICLGLGANNGQAAVRALAVVTPPFVVEQGEHLTGFSIDLWNEIADRLKAGGLTNVATFDGRTSNGKRNDILSLGHEALILQIQTGCEGLNLQEHYSEIYFISPHWNPAIEDQAVARCHRIGQTKVVHVERFEMCEFPGDEDQETDTMTIDKYVNVVQQGKRFIARETIDQSPTA